MERANLSKITAPDFTASLRSIPQKVVVVDEAKIPLEWFRLPTPEEAAAFAAGVLDKRKLLKALQDNTNMVGIEGATLSNSAKTISIRTK